MHATYSQDTRPGLLVTVTSFGFKHGLPVDADLVFDVRFLANPHYVPELKYLSGQSAAVAAYVHADPLTAPFQTRMNDLVDFALPQYQREGKAYLNIAIGCTGGQHRSVVLAEDLAAQLLQHGYRVTVRHRDIDKTKRQTRRASAGRGSGGLRGSSADRKAGGAAGEPVAKLAQMALSGPAPETLDRGRVLRPGAVPGRAWGSSSRRTPPTATRWPCGWRNGSSATPISACGPARWASDHAAWAGFSACSPSAN